MAEEIRFVDVGDGRVAYQIHGAGDLDFVLVSGLVGHLDVTMEEPRYRRFVETLNEYGRVIRFDRRGTGLSDPVPPTEGEVWELWVEDLIGVLDDAGSRQAVVIASNDAGPTAFLFAATYPDKLRALVLFNTTARFLEAEDYPEGHPPEVAASLVELLRSTWGTEAAADLLAPSVAADQSFRRWYARFQRASGSPAAVAASMKRIMSMDARGALSEVSCPTLVLHREGYAVAGTAHAEYLARSIPNAVFEVVPGSDSMMLTEHMRETVARIGRFVGRAPAPLHPRRMFSTVLFTDIVSSTELAVTLGDDGWQSVLERHDSLARSIVGENGGRLIKTTGDGILATFEAPTRAVQSARSILLGVRELGIQVRAGLHAGSVVVRDDGDISGVAVNVAARVLGRAGDGEILVSRSIPDLLVGESFRFEDRGTHPLKGIPEPQALFAVTDAS